jgi:hypothetical protein
MSENKSNLALKKSNLNNEIKTAKVDENVSNNKSIATKGQKRYKSEEGK